MTIKRFLAAATSPLGRWIAVILGLSGVFLSLYRFDLHHVVSVLLASMSVFPLVLFLEVCILACSMCALRTLYSSDRKKIPLRMLVRAGLVGYAVMGLLPAGRTAAEATRASLLSRYSGVAKATVAATYLQALALLANSFISLLATGIMYSYFEWSFPTLLIAGNFVITATMGFGIIFTCQRSEIGTRLGRRLEGVLPKFLQFGEQLDLHLRIQSSVQWTAFSWEVLGRVIQVFQNGVLVVAVGGKLGVANAFISEALHLVGASVGDLIPGQLGVTEFNYRFFASALSLYPSDAISIALLAHLSQLFWVVVGLIVPMVWKSEKNTGYKKIKKKEQENLLKKNSIRNLINPEEAKF